MKKIVMAGALALNVFALAACNANSTDTKEQNEQHSAYPVTIENYTKAQDASTWSTKDQVIEKTPEKVLATTRPVADLLLRLGLKDNITAVSANFGAFDESVAGEFEKLNVISDTYIGQEVALGTSPDLIVSRGDLFADGDGRIGVVDNYNDMGINTYVLASSIQGATYETVYEDIENLGKIFNVEDNAEALITNLKEKETTIREKLDAIDKKKTFAYMHTNDPSILKVEAQSQDSFFNDVLGMVNLENIFINETGDISLETFIEADPDIIIIPKWDGTTNLDAVREEMYQNEQLSNMKAIKNRAIHVVDYSHLWGYSYTSIYGMEQLAKEIYPDLFTE